jgi:hypothetical protein
LVVVVNGGAKDFRQFLIGLLLNIGKFIGGFEVDLGGDL